MGEKQYDNVVVTIPDLDIERRDAGVAIRSANSTYRTHVWWNPAIGSNGTPIGDPDVDAPDEKVIIETGNV